MKAKTTAAVDAYVRQAQTWRKETAELRSIALEGGLTEAFKWGKPCYTFQGNNVVIIQGFKAYCALMFCQGALLQDPRGILQKPGEHTQAARQVRFTHVREVVALKPALRAYLREAIAAEKAGLKVQFKKSPEPIPEELQKKLAASPALRAAFSALTPGRQRAYLLYFSAAKQSQTRDSRIEKCRPQILQGKGRND